MAAAPAPADAEDGQDIEGGEDSVIVVTGSLIRGAVADPLAPLAVIDSAELARQGSPGMMEIARALPVSSGVLGDSSQFDARSQFNQGSASINLRGLGPQRTLTLLNGRRMVASGAGNLPLVDVNLFPVAAIDRIEILKDGGAATYGSDAIAGVVNVITRTDQDGFRIGGDYRHVRGSDGDWTGAVSWGGRIGSARLFVSGGYQRRSELTVPDRGFAMRPYSENPQGGYSGGGNPGNFDFDATLNGIAFTADEGCEGVGAFRSEAGSAADLCLANYLGFTNLVEPEERFQIFADLELPLADGVTARLTALYGRTETELNTSPSFLPTISPSAQAAFGGSGLFVIPAYAPALVDYCARFGAAAGCATDASGTPLAPALAYPVRFRPILLAGNPLFDNDRGSARLLRDSDAYQLTGELRVDLTSALSFVTTATYSEYDRYFQVGDSYVDLLQNALAGFGGANCPYATAQSRAGLSSAQLAALAGTGGCTYFNPFSTAIAANVLTSAANPNYAGNGSPAGLDGTPGAGLVNDLATIDDFYNVFGRTANTRQWVVDMVLSGESGIELPGGPVGFAIGGQFRRDLYARTYESGNNLDLFPCPASVLDPDAQCVPETGALGFIGSNRDTAVNSDVWAGFAELNLPLTARLEAQLAARYEDYGGSVGSTFDPQARLRFELADGITLRGGVGATFRGPPPQNTAADLVILTFIGGAFRAVDILANPGLRPESAIDWSGGLAIRRGGFNASIDYWRYELSGPIEAEPVSGLVSALFGTGGADNCGDPAYAALEARFTFSGGVCGAANVQRLTTFAFNAADVTTSGVDFHATYDFALPTGTVQAGVDGSYTIEYSVDEVLVEGMRVQGAFDAAGKLNYQTTAYPLPEWKGRAWLQGSFGEHAMRVQVNYVSDYTDGRGSGVFGPNPNLQGRSVTAGQRIGSFTTLDATWIWSRESGTTVSLALLNLLDKDPPFARLDQSFDPFTASPLGLTAKLGIGQKF